MIQTLHFVRKDLRRLRWWLVAWAALLAARVVLTTNEWRVVDTNAVGEQFVFGQVSAIVAAVTTLLLALLVARLVHEEPLVGLDWFWFTRPYNRQSLAAAKLFLGVVPFVILPLAAELVVMAIFDAGPRDMLRAGSVFLARDAMWLLGLMVVAVLTPSLMMFAIGLLGSAAALAVAMVALMSVTMLTVDEETAPPPDAFADPTASLVAAAVFIAAALAVIIYQYHRRRPAGALALAGAGAVALLVAPAVWPWPLAGRTAIDTGAWARDASVSAVVDRSVPPQITNEMGFSRRRGPRHQVAVQVWLRGLPADYRIAYVMAESRLEFPDGQVLQSVRSGPASSLSLSEAYPETSSLHGALGDVALMPTQEPDRVPMTALLTISDADLARYRGRSGRLTTTLHYSLQRSRVIGAIPLVEGAAVDAPARRFEILRIERRDDGCVIGVRQWQASSMLSIPEYRQFDFILRNAGRGEAFTADRRDAGFAGQFSAGSFYFSGLSIGRGGLQGFDVNYVGLDYPRRSMVARAGRPIEPEWQANADLVIVETAFAGIVSRTLTLADFSIGE